jgi:short-chain fatty acids transporter
MLTKLGEKFTGLFEKYMPNSFVFAMLLTLIIVVISFFWTDASPLKIIQSWYDGFWSLLEFGMQIVLIIITGFAIALSPIINKGIDRLVRYIKSPEQVYFFVTLIGGLLCLISFGWIVVTCILARQLALRVKGINYPFLIACVYFSAGSWVTGLSSSIPLLVGTENNYLIEAEILNETIPTALTLGSHLNMVVLILYLVFTPFLMLFLAPKTNNNKELNTMLEGGIDKKEISIHQEASNQNLAYKSFSDQLNTALFFRSLSF